MFSPKFYIIQLLAVLLLLCGYFLSDPAGGLAAMHFNPNPETPSVISKASKSTAKVYSLHKISSGQSDRPGRSNIVKYVSLELIMPQHEHSYHFVEVPNAAHSCALPERYSFLFFREINPPPPKMC